MSVPISEKKYYIYYHYDSFGNLRYIGKGHGRRAWARGRRNPYWKSVFRHSTPVVKIVCENFDEESSLKLEALHIYLSHIRGDPLVNIVPGGGVAPTLVGCDNPKYGKPVSKETRERLSKNHVGMRGRKHSIESRKKISESLKGRSSWNKGIPPSEETRRKLSKSLTGSGSYNFGKHLSEETRRKLSIANKGKVPWSKGKKFPNRKRSSKSTTNT